MMYKVVLSIALLVASICSFTSSSGAQALSRKWEKVFVDSHVVPYKLAFYDSLLGYLVATSDAWHLEDSTQTRLYRTIDGGRSWEKLMRPRGVYPIPSFISTPTSHDLFFLGGYGSKNPEVLHSSDSGKSWTAKHAQPANSPHFYRMWTPSMGYRHVERFRKWDDQVVTYDSGRNFQFRSYHPVFTEFMATDTIDPTIEWLDTLRGLYLLSSPSKRVLPMLQTLDGGMTWDSLPLPNEKLARLNVDIKIEPVAGKIWLRILDSVESLFYSSNVGASWEAYRNYPLQLLQIYPVEDGLWGIRLRKQGGFVDGNTNDILMYSQDYGAHWMQDSTSFEGLRILAAHFIGKNNGWVFTVEDSTLFAYRMSDSAASSVDREKSSEANLTVRYRSGEVLIDGAGDGAKLVRVSDILGREYYPRTHREFDRFVIQISGLPPSRYFVQYEVAGSVRMASFIVGK